MLNGTNKILLGLQQNLGERHQISLQRFLLFFKVGSPVTLMLQLLSKLFLCSNDDTSVL